MNLSDRDILMDLLIDTKYISTGYHQAVLESATDRVRNALMQIHNDELASHRRIFDLMKSRGYYQVQPAAPAGAPQYQAGTQGMGMAQPMGGAMGNFMGAAGAATGGMGMMGTAVGGMGYTGTAAGGIGQGMGQYQQGYGQTAPGTPGQMAPGSQPRQ